MWKAKVYDMYQIASFPLLAIVANTNAHIYAREE